LQNFKTAPNQDTAAYFITEAARRLNALCENGSTLPTKHLTSP
jgi:hypothetical protein